MLASLSRSLLVSSFDFLVALGCGFSFSRRRSLTDWMCSIKASGFIDDIDISS